MKIRELVYCFLVTLCLGAAWANGQTTAYVSRYGVCSGHNPCYSTIQGAIDAVSFPSTIKITQETYEEDVVLDADQLMTLEGGWDTSFTSCSSYTVIRGSLTLVDGTTIIGGTGKIIVSPPPPTINSFSANPGSINLGSSSTLSWAITKATSASIDHGVGSVNPASGSIDVSPGATTTYTLTATNGAGSVTAQATVTVIVPPMINVFSVDPATIDVGQSSTLSWIITNATSASIDQGVGSVDPVSGSINVSPTATTTYTLTATNPAGSVTTQITVTVTGSLPPDPSTVAPPLNLTVPTILFSGTEFLYTGTNPIQTGVADGTIEPKRAAVLRGKVLKRDGSPLFGATISILGRPEYGQTLSRLDGMFDLVVNGGSVLTISYGKPGFLKAQRQADVPWQEYVTLPDVVLIPLDTEATSVDLPPLEMQIARGTVQTDTDGSRQATLLIPQGTTGQMVLSGGGTQPLTTLTLRATEYTVGPDGLKAMPAELPPNVGYTYCVELTADEAEQAGATRVEFSQPLPIYVENFLGFPVGTKVPSGYYDRVKAAWVPSPNGVVIKIVSVTGGSADLDVDKIPGADPSLYISLGITDAERQALATLYSIGQELWRIPITHFSPWDYNWPYGPPSTATPPMLPPLEQKTPYAEPCMWTGSILECQNQALGQEIPVTGTPFKLSYRSHQTMGRKDAYSLEIPLSGVSVPADVRRIQLEVSVAGRVFRNTFPPNPNQTHLFTWDGKDAYGRYVQGSQTVMVSVGYDYQAFYMEPAQWKSAFNSYSGTPVTVDSARGEITLWQRWTGTIGTWVSNYERLGGFNLDVHHAYDRQGGVLYRGDGTEYNAKAIGSVIVTRVAGMPLGTPKGDGGPALNAFLNDPRGITVGSDGSIYFIDSYGYQNFTVRKITPDGIINTLPGLSSLTWVNEIALGPDGSLYLADFRDYKIYRYDPVLHTLTTVAGNGLSGAGCEECLATVSALMSPQSITVGPDGTIYISEAKRIRKVDVNGIITTVAGNASLPGGFSGDGGPASLAILSYPYDLSLGPDGALYFSDYNNERVRRITPDGVIRTVAGSGSAFCNPYPNCDGIKATDATLHILESVAVSPDGTIYLTDSKRRIRRVTPDGMITGLLTDYGLEPLYHPAFGGEGRPPAVVQFYPRHLAIGPDHNLYVSGYQLNVDTPYTKEYGMIIKITSSLKGLEVGEFVVPSRDGTEIYVFNAEGRHDRTLNAYTHSVIYQFYYDSAGLLIRVDDAYGNSTSIERDAAGFPAAIMGPFGHRTGLVLDGNGYLASIGNPAGETTSFTFAADGLMTGMTEPKGNSYVFTYNGEGRLIQDEDPEHNLQTLARSKLSAGYSVLHTTAEGRQTKYQVERLNTYYERQVNTFPTGAQTVSDLKQDGSIALTFPDGSTTLRQQNPDPRFGIVAPLPRFSQTMPSGHGFYSDSTRNVVLTDPQNPFSVQSITEDVSYCTGFDLYSKSCIDADTYRTVYTALDKKFTSQSPEGRKREVLVNGQGSVKQIDFPGALGIASTTFSYDAKGLINQIVFGDVKQTFVYDPMGRVQSASNAAAETSQFSYDAANRVTGVTLPLGSSYGFSYDPNSNLTRITMPSGAIHGLSYNGWNLLSGYTPPYVPPATALSYAWTYNKDRNLTQTALPGGGSLNFSYDAGGRMTEVQYPEAYVQLRYNDLTTRPYQIEWIHSSGPSHQIEYAYDGSLLKRATYSGLTTGYHDYTYGKNYRLEEIYFEYDRGGGLGWDWDWIPLVRDRDGFVVEFGDFSLTREPTLGRLSAIGDSGYGIHPLQINYTYDLLGRLSGRTHTVNGVQIYNLQLTRDNTGRIIQKADGATYNYAYDLDGQLKEVRKNTTLVEQYAYDINANRTSTLAATAHFDVQDRITDQGSVLYVHNDDGYLIQRGSDTFEYSTRGELLQTNVGGVTTQYAYDGYGRRVGQKIGSGGWNKYYYGDPYNNYLVTATQDASGAFTFYRYDDFGHLFAFACGPDWDNPVWYYVATDQVGTPRVISDASGNTVKTVEYDSYGVLLSDNNPGFDLPIGFAGGINDAVIGMVRFGARDYDPATGRWAAKDPKLFRGGQGNLYQYVFNNPVSFRDPKGQVAFLVPILKALIALGALDIIYQSYVNTWGDAQQAVDKPLEEVEDLRKQAEQARCKGDFNKLMELQGKKNRLYLRSLTTDIKDIGFAVPTATGNPANPYSLPSVEDVARDELLSAARNSGTTE